EDRDAAPAAVVELHDHGAPHRRALQARVEEGHDAAVGRIADSARHHRRAVEVAAQGAQHAAQNRAGGAGVAGEGAGEGPAATRAVDRSEPRGRRPLRQWCRAHAGRGEEDPYREGGEEEALAGHARSGSAILGRHPRRVNGYSSATVTGITSTSAYSVSQIGWPTGSPPPALMICRTCRANMSRTRRPTTCPTRLTSSAMKAARGSTHPSEVFPHSSVSCPLSSRTK